jgi:hypothetical protein
VSAISRANFCRPRLCRAIAALAIVAVSAGPAFAQALSFAPAFRSDPPLPQYAPQQQDDEAASEQLPAQLRRQMVHIRPMKRLAPSLSIPRTLFFI